MRGWSGIGVLALVAICLQGEQPLVFDVVSVKASAPGATRGIVRQMPGNQRYLVANAPLRTIMTVAYSVTDRQISGGPSWVGTDQFDIDAKSERPHTSDELHDMLARLLEDRFQLKVRREARELPVYELVVDKGSKMPVHDPADLEHAPMAGTKEGLKGANVTMTYFAFMLSRNLDRNVIDRTGLTEHYDVNLTFAREGLPVEAEGPSIFTAVKEQLGLKLVPAKGPVEFLVIERAEKPGEN